MLTIPLPRLEREGTLDIQAEIPPEDAIWDGTELRFSTPLEVSGQAKWLSSGDVLVRLTLRGERAQECRRCLEPVTVALEESLSLLFTPPGDDESEADDGDARPLSPDAIELDLVEVVREELILADRPYVVCREGCRGLCSICGINLNEESCQCSVEEPDPRWDALRALKDERD